MFVFSATNVFVIRHFPNGKYHFYMCSMYQLKRNKPLGEKNGASFWAIFEPCSIRGRWNCELWKIFGSSDLGFFFQAKETLSECLPCSMPVLAWVSHWSTSPNAHFQLDAGGYNLTVRTRDNRNDMGRMQNNWTIETVFPPVFSHFCGPFPF